MRDPTWDPSPPAEAADTIRERGAGPWLPLVVEGWSGPKTSAEAIQEQIDIMDAAIREAAEQPRSTTTTPPWARFKFWSDGLILVDTTPEPITFKVAPVASAEAFPIGAYLHNYAILPKGLRIIDDPPPESAVDLPARPSVEPGPNRKERRKAAALARGGGR